MMGTLLAEWTKLRTVRRWMIAVFAAVVLTVGLGLLAASGGGSDANTYPDFVVGPDGDPVADEMQLVHRPLDGDGSVTVRVATQADGRTGARAGVIIKQEAKSGSPYAALYVTPRGVRMEANFGEPVHGSGRTAPVWLRLTRAGTTVTGDESPDGTTWTRVAQVRVAKLTPAVRAGFFVSSPPELRVERNLGSTGSGYLPTVSTATFDTVAVAGDTAAGTWVPETLVMHPSPDADDRGGPDLGVEERDGVYTVAGAGAVGPKPSPDDTVEIALFGVLAGLMALVAVAALFVTSEYRSGLIRTTFTATPLRGRTLAAKAVVVAVVAFVTGLVGGAAALLLAQPVLQEHGFAPPAFPPYALTDWPVARTLLLTAVFLAGLGVFTVGLGAILRHSAATITVVIVLVVMPVILGSVLPLAPCRWLMRLTPAGGLATWRSKPPTTELATPWSLLSPGEGLTVVGAYAAMSMLAAWWLLRKRDA